MKFYKEYIFNRSIPQWSCFCEICENAVMLCTGINKVIPNNEIKHAGESSWYCGEALMWGCRWTERLYDGWLLKLHCEQSFFVQLWRIQLWEQWYKESFKTHELKWYIISQIFLFGLWWKTFLHTILSEGRQPTNLWPRRNGCRRRKSFLKM